MKVLSLKEATMKKLIDSFHNILSTAISVHKEKLTISLSGGIDSMVIHHLTNKLGLKIENIFSNLQVENTYNRRVAKEAQKKYKNIYNAKTESYRSIVYRLGFPIGDKIFSDRCERVARPLTLNNAVTRYKLITGNDVNFRTGDKAYVRYGLPLKYWYLAKNYPIQTSCCRILKKQPSENLYKEHGLIQVIGAMKSDSLDRRTSINREQKKPILEQKKIFPLAEWTKADVLEYMHTYMQPSDYSRFYQEREVRNGLRVEGATNSGCAGCHYGVRQKFACSDGIERNKFEIQELEFPKKHKAVMNMKHKTGVTYAEVIKVYEDSKRGKYIEESKIILDKEIREVSRLLALKRVNYNRQFLLTFLSYPTIEERIEILSFKIKNMI
jgi:3'-phosphoadenosine 5'-phosphosulfate sulfotransferase (PAPS reductase)/FAD synthetase